MFSLSISRRRVAAVVTAFAVICGLTVATQAATGPGLAQADTAPPAGVPATVSVDALPTVQVDGVVWAQTIVGNTVYVTGDFDYARPAGVKATATHDGSTRVYNLIAYDITTGKMSTTFIPQLNAGGRSLAVSPDGQTLYVGGDFTKVGAETHNHLAAFNIASGLLISAFKANIGYRVNAIVPTAGIAPAPDTVYIGGAFSGAGGQVRSDLAAVRADTGALTPWAPATNTGSVVYAMVLSPDKSRIIVAGNFSTINGVTANGSGAVDVNTGATLPWAASTIIYAYGKNAAMDTLSTDGTYIFGGGFAWTQDAATFSNFEGTFAADPNTGNLIWVNGCHGDTYNVLPIGQVLYVAGHAHDCAPIGSFPDSHDANSPQGEYHRAIADATYAGSNTNTSTVAGTYKYLGVPAADLLDWFPDMGPAPATTAAALPGTYAVSGASEAAWSVTGNSSYVSLGGEMTTAAGYGQSQGITRYAIRSIAPNRIGPEVTSVIAPALSLGAVSPNITVAWNAGWDRDNTTLTYAVYRDAGTTPIYTTTANSTFWQTPPLSYTDTTASVGSHTYYLKVSDPNGVTVTSPTSAPITTTTTPSTDLALFRATASSSAYQGSVAGRAVDGNTDGVWSHNSVALTNNDVNSWWWVDLGAAATPISSIQIYNRTDGSFATMSNYWVFISDTAFNTALTPAQQAATAGVTAIHQTTAPSPLTTLTLPAGSAGRYIMVQQNGQMPLQLAELVVN